MIKLNGKELGTCFRILNKSCSFFSGYARNNPHFNFVAYKAPQSDINFFDADTYYKNIRIACPTGEGICDHITNGGTMLVRFDGFKSEVLGFGKSTNMNLENQYTEKGIGADTLKCGYLTKGNIERYVFKKYQYPISVSKTNISITIPANKRYKITLIFHAFFRSDAPYSSFMTFDWFFKIWGEKYEIYDMFLKDSQPIIGTDSNGPRIKYLYLEKIVSAGSSNTVESISIPSVGISNKWDDYPYRFAVSDYYLFLRWEPV